MTWETGRGYLSWDWDDFTFSFWFARILLPPDVSMCVCVHGYLANLICICVFAYLSSWYGVLCVDMFICVFGMLNFVILVNLLHSFIKVPFWKEKKEGGEKLYIYIWKEDVVADMVIAVEQSEAKSQEKKGETTAEQNTDRECHLYLIIYYDPLFCPTGYHLSSSNSVRWHIGLRCIRKSRFFETK